MTARIRPVPGGRHAGLAAPTLVVTSLVLSGCMSMSGLSGSSSYACKAPEGVTCDSVSGTYANAVQNNLPSQRRPASVGATSAATPPAPDGGLVADADAGAAAASGAAARVGKPVTGTSPAPASMPLRSSARILRLWFKPWEDADRDLYDQGYVYVQIDGGQWLIEHAQRQIREAYAPLRPPPRAAAPAAESREPTTPPRPAGLPHGISAPPWRSSDGD